MASRSGPAQSAPARTHGSLVHREAGIGASLQRTEDRRFLLGDGLYTADITIAGQAYMHVVQSLHAHARIRAIDAGGARQMPGVFAVLTSEDAEADGLGPIPCQFFPEDLPSSGRLC